MKLKIKHTNLVCFLVFIITMELFYSCGNVKNHDVIQPLIESTPKIIFLNYQINKVSDSLKNIKLTGKTVVDGKFKNPKTTKNNTFGDLICLQLDKKSNILHQTVIKNPLFKTIEFVNDFKQFQTKHIYLDSANFSVRLQLKQNTKYISITEVTSNSSISKPLITTKLN